MERLIEYMTHHPLLAGAAVLALIVVLTYESRMRATSFAVDFLAGPDPAHEPGRPGARHPQARGVRAGHVNGAKHLPSDQILTAGDTFKQFKEKPVVVYCDSGSLAAAAVRQLNAQGFTKAFKLRGGFAGWRAENLPVAKAD